MAGEPQKISKGHHKVPTASNLKDSGLGPVLPQTEKRVSYEAQLPCIPRLLTSQGPGTWSPACILQDHVYRQ